MGLFKFFKNRRVKTDRVREPEAKALREEAFTDRQTREDFITGNCEIVCQAEKAITDSKKEYEVVTSYLADIQKIDLIPGEAKAKINANASRIMTLTRERQELTLTPPKITMAQRLAIQEFTEEGNMDKEILRLEKNEKYREEVENDLRLLEEERDSLDDEIVTDINKSEFSRKILTVATVIIGLSLIFLIVARAVFERDVTALFILIFVFGAASGAYFFLYYRRTILEKQEDERKLDRAITLLNKVKIKYVNVVNLLDYNYEKYHVVNCEDLKYNWKEYQRILEEERVFKKTEQMLSSCTEELVKQLKAEGVQDANIWVYQVAALLDPREMVEVRHRLNTRRQKLRKSISYNEEQKKTALLALRSFVLKHSEYEMETKMIMSRFNLTI